jgi:hypothetical protein
MKRLSLVCFMVEALLFTSYVSLQVSGASIGELSIVQVTYQQQIHQIFHALTEAINDTTTYSRCTDCILDGSTYSRGGDLITYNLDCFSPALPPDQRESVTQRVYHFMDSYKDSSPECRLTFKPYVTVDLKNGYRSMVEVLVEYGDMAARITVEVNFHPGELCPVITNLNEVLDEVEPFLEKSVEEMKPYASKVKRIRKSASATTPFLSDNLLLPNYIGYGNYKRFTSSVSHAEYGYDILSGPYGLFCMVYRDQQMPQLDREFLIVADRNDNRITATTKNLNNPDQPYWFQQIGPFYHPMAVAQMGQNWYVSEDTVVHVYWSDWNGNWSHRDYLVGGFKNIVDMDAARIPTGGNDIWEVSVLDRVNKTIKVFNYDGVLQRTLSTYCSDPTALCYARNGITGYKNHYLYVLDNDGNRIVRIDSWGIAVPIISDPGLFPSDAQLTSATTDAYATLYVLDRNNSVCHVFGGMEPIATFGIGPGTADNQLYYPRRMKIAEGWKYYTGPDSVGPLHLGDGFLTELYASNTGLRRFVLGCDVVEDTMKYFPQYQPGYGDRVGIYWRISNTAETWREVWADGTQLDYQHDPINVPGSHYHVYWLDESDPDSTWYKFIIRVKSIYGTTDTTFIDSLYIERHLDPGPRFVFDYPDLFDPSGEFPRWCFHRDTGRWWGLSITGEDRHQDSTLLLGTWSKILNCIKLYKDTISCEYAWYLLHESADTVWFKFKYYPQGHPEGGYAQIFTTLYSTDPYDSTKPEYYNYNWYDDTVKTYEQLYSKACETPCTPDCPPIPQGCPFVYIWDGNQYGLVNNILPESEITGTDVTDWLPIYDAYHVDSQYYPILIAEDENEVSYFKQLGLNVFDVPVTGNEVVVTNDRKVCVLTGSVTNPISVVTNDGEDVTHLFSDDESVFQANGYGYIDLEYAVPPSDSGIIIGSQEQPLPKAYMKPGTEGDQTSNTLTLYAKNENGEWEAVDEAYPRMQQDQILVDLSDYVSDGSLSLRLEWTTEISISNLPYAIYKEVDVAPQPAELVSAVHSDNGEVSNKLGKITDQVVLSPGKNIELTFKAEPPADGMTRVLLFEVTGRYETMATLADGILASFEFPQNYPNPFNPTTTFSFSLPRAEHVRLEIFNILGQKVVTVVDGDYEAGDHKVEWDGSAHSSGVYLYRLEAGEFTESKKMLLLK